MRLLIDMNLSPEWGPYLESCGFGAVHWRDLGPATAEDRAIFDHARDHDLVIVTQDLDFGTLLARTNASKPSVVLIRSPDITPAHLGDFLIRAVRAAAPDLAAGAILTLEHDRPRVRLLPFRPESAPS